MLDKAIQGKDVVVFMARYNENGVKEKPRMVPFQTTSNLSFKREINSTEAKDQKVTTYGPLETDFSMEFIHNTSAIAETFRDSILDKQRLEVWVVEKERRNEKNEVYGTYLLVDVTEDGGEANTTDAVSRSLSFSVAKEPVRLWLKLSNEQEDAINYVYRGLDEITEDDKNGGAQLYK